MRAWRKARSLQPAYLALKEPRLTPSAVPMGGLPPVAALVGAEVAGRLRKQADSGGEKENGVGGWGTPPAAPVGAKQTQGIPFQLHSRPNECMMYGGKKSGTRGAFCTK